MMTLLMLVTPALVLAAATLGFARPGRFGRGTRIAIEGRVIAALVTAPVVVASGISLQCHGSSFAPEVIGGGNKLLHNAVGGFGAVEGNSGTLRTGLPWQSVHDGAALVHEPLRLTVCVEAAREAMAAIIDRYQGIAAFFDNRRQRLFAPDNADHMAWRYAGHSRWELLEVMTRAANQSKLAA